MAWMLSVMALLVGVSGFLLEKQKLDAAELRAEGAAKAEVRARADLTEVTDANRALGVRVQELQGQLSHLTAKSAIARAEPEKKHASPSKKARRKHAKSRHHR
jgi:hypothetical protein